ncbi:hypothetical protein B1757_06085 [Acidithiobacillus marinus]|uniref:Phosphonate metabolism protein n=1 Tax=Acidithiobacillus marinus TaxID=187490 RepID=A0A2I1DMQ0_9PROT|nr:DUF1045 domain-containing protein [Acidithiobacillus marinus]PKY11150.1 hypothetical protein B1757_06085 [Acidithiobacillus marinus]
MRVAIYYLPEADDPLWEAGCRWLGWNPESALPCARPAVDGLAEASRRASRYGFHATIKAPMPLQGDLDSLVQILSKELAAFPAFTLPPLQCVQDEGFVALRLSRASAELARLADSCVRSLEPWRRPYTAEELAARSRKLQHDRQRQYLQQWGYPYVFEEFIFHMTLSDQQPDSRLLEAAQSYFGNLPAQPRLVRSLAVLVENSPDAPFTLLQRVPLAPCLVPGPR